MIGIIITLFKETEIPQPSTELEYVELKTVKQILLWKHTGGLDWKRKRKTLPGLMVRRLKK